MAVVKNIDRWHGPNAPGLRRIFLIFADQVITADPLVLQPGTKWHELHLSDLDSSFGYDQKEVEPFAYDVSLSFPGNNEALAYIRNHFVGREFVLVAEDLYNELHIIGDERFPFTCRISGENSYNIRFSGKLPSAPTTLAELPEADIFPLARRFGPNPKGIRQVKILLADEVLYIPEPNEAGVITENPEVNEAGEVLAYYTGDLDTGYDLTIDQKEKGKILSHKLQLKMATGNLLVWIAEKFARRQLILIIEDLFGDAYIIGTLKNPLGVRVKCDSGGDAGFRGFTLTFEGETATPAYKFEGSLEPVPPPVPPPPAPTMMDFDPSDFDILDFY